MTSLKFKAAMALACAFSMLEPALAQGVDWNDQLTQEVLGERGVYPFGSLPENADAVDHLLQSEMYVQSERLSRSGARTLKRVKKMPGVVEMSASDYREIAAWPEYIQVIDVRNPDGTTVALSTVLSPQEVEQLKLDTAGAPREVLAAEMTAMSDGLVMLGGALRRGIENSRMSGVLAENSIADGMVSGSGSDYVCEDYFAAAEKVAQNDGDPGVVFFDMATIGGLTPEWGLDPAFYTLGPACMLAASASELEALPDSSSPEAFAQAQAAVMKAVNKSAKLAGDDTVDGHRTKRIVVEDLGLKQTTDDGAEMTINDVSIWLDPEYFVRRKIRMEGTIKRGRESEAFFMERENQDYRRVGETFLYEPYREVMKVGGIMSKKEQKELAKAQKELESAKKQLAQMPASQRSMMEGMFASQMAQLESLVNDGAATVTVITTDIEINPGFADTPIVSLSGPGHSETLIRLIQTDLAKLGFEPGPATGKINAATSDAISAYQASRNMTVNGAPSAELATALQAETSGL